MIMKHTKPAILGTRAGNAHAEVRLAGAVLSFALSLTLSLAACSLPDSAASPLDLPSSAPLDHALGLTPEQRLEDYTYLWDTLRSSYLCFGIHDRSNPEHTVDEIYEKYREMIVESDSDEEFYSAIYSTLWLLNGYSHLSILEPKQYEEMRDTAQTLLADRASYAPWLAQLTDDRTQRSYERLAAFLDVLYGEDEGGDDETVVETSNLHPLILPGGTIAYIKIDGFPADYAADQATLFAF